MLLIREVKSSQKKDGKMKTFFYQVVYGNNSGSKKNFDTLNEAKKFAFTKINSKVWEQTSGLKRQTSKTQRMV